MKFWLHIKFKSFVICGVLASTLSGQAINIKGTVVDGSSKPIKGAAVHLLKADKIEFTNESGEFTITADSRPVSAKPYNPSAFIGFSAPGISINKLYDVKGALKAVFPQSHSDENAVSGSQNPLFRAPGITIAQTRQGGKTRYGKFGMGGSRVSVGSNTGKAPRSLQKLAATDELVISAMGKTQQRMDISELNKDVGQIKLGDNGTGKNGKYNMLKFKFEGRDAYIVVPDNPHPAKPWIWRSTFFIPDDDPMLDWLMVSKGYYRVNINQKDLMGNDESIEISAKFHDMLVNYFGFWPKVVISGWSQAGFHIFRFAGKHPDKVSVVAADAATCNWRAWPKKPPWGMSRQEGEEFKENPSDSAMVGPMVKAGVAVIHEVRTNDGTVNPEWTYTMQELYEDMGGTYEVIKTPGSKHTDHFLKPELIEPFITKHNPLDPPIK